MKRSNNFFTEFKNLNPDLELLLLQEDTAPICSAADPLAQLDFKAVTQELRTRTKEFLDQLDVIKLNDNTGDVLFSKKLVKAYLEVLSASDRFDEFLCRTYKKTTFRYDLL